MSYRSYYSRLTGAFAAILAVAVGAPASLGDPVYFPVTRSYYERVDVRASWTSAEAAAEGRTYVGRQGRLVTLSSAEENAFVADLLEGAPIHFYWVGALQPPDSCEPDCDWGWITGEPWSYSNWNDGEPNNTHGIEDVAGMYSTLGNRGKWNDGFAGDEMGYIVEYEASSNSPNAPCSWRMTRHVAPEPGGYASHTQGGGKLWLFRGGDCPGGRGLSSFDPWDGFNIHPDAGMRADRAGPAMAFLDGFLYIIGGATDIVDRYNPATGEWNEGDEVPNLPSIILHASAEVLDGKIYVFGGLGCCGGHFSNETYVYDPDCNCWIAGPPMCNAGGNRATTVVDDCIYAIGGASDCSSDGVGRQWSERYCLGEEEWECLDDFPVRLREGGAVTVGKKIWIISGRETDSDGIVPYVWVHDTATNDGWTRTEDVIQERRGHVVAVFGTGIYMIGGGRQGEDPPLFDSVEHVSNTMDCFCQYDVDFDGQVNPVDSGLVQASFGEDCAAP